jgi:hypothetical protein
LEKEEAVLQIRVQIRLIKSLRGSLFSIGGGGGGGGAKTIRLETIQVMMILRGPLFRFEGGGAKTIKK